MTLEEYDNQLAHNKNIENWAKITRPIFGNITELEYYISDSLVITMEFSRVGEKIQEIFNADSVFYNRIKKRE